MKLKLEEHVYSKENLVAELTNYKETLNKLENNSNESFNNKGNNDRIPVQCYNKNKNQENSQKQVVGDLKNVN